MPRTRKQGPRTVARRRLLQVLTLAAPVGSAGQEQTATIETIRHAAEIHGMNLSDERLRTIQPSLERRLRELRAIRDLDMDETVEPAPVFAPKRASKRP